MKKNIFVILLMITLMGCINQVADFTESEKRDIHKLIKNNIYAGIEATRNKDVETYMSLLPEDLLIYDENGEVITWEKQKEYVLRDWAIIDTTLSIKMEIDSIKFESKDKVIVFTSQLWKRMMFQRDGVKTDTVLTTQRHKEIWKKNIKGWFGYEIEELGGEIFINGKEYKPQ